MKCFERYWMSNMINNDIKLLTKALSRVESRVGGDLSSWAALNLGSKSF
jgi:hypothetical protein